MTQSKVARVIGIFKSLGERLRISTVRMAVINLLLFIVGILITIGVVYWEVTVFMEKRVDHIIDVNAANLDHIGTAEVLKRVDDSLRRDSRKIDFYGVFTSEGVKIGGNLRYLPAEIGLDGQIREFKNKAVEGKSVYGGEDTQSSLARAKARLVDEHLIVVVGRDIGEFVAIRQILLNGLIVGSSVVLIFGLAVGFILSIRPLRRIEAIKAITNEIMLGNFHLRIPISRHLDELDMLSGTVNLMLAETEKLLVEIKGVTSTIAHDLRTPLTRVRFFLSNGLNINSNKTSALASKNIDIFHKSIEQTDRLLERFTAVLRVAEIENHMRKVGFKNIDPKIVLDQIVEMFEPIAEEKGLKLALNIESSGMIFADHSLLLEAISNLVDNALKFSSVNSSVLETLPRVPSPDPDPDPDPNSSLPAVKINLRRFNDCCVIEVCDPGVGMSEELMEYLNSDHAKDSNVLDKEIFPYLNADSPVNSIQSLDRKQKGENMSLNPYPYPNLNSRSKSNPSLLQPVSTKKALNSSKEDFQNSELDVEVSHQLGSGLEHRLGLGFGHGLGLGIVRAILRLHQFRLVVRPTRPGTHISIYCCDHS